MLVPKFTIRRALLGMVLAGFVFGIAAAAVDGQMWAISITIALLSLIIVFALHAVSFSFASLAATLLPRRHSRQERQGPFATTRMPPTLIRPSSPDSD